MRALKDHLKLMARALVLALVVASPLVARADDAMPDADADRGQTRVIGGHKAADGAWLSQVKIFAPDPAGRGRYRALCGGTAVASEWILTAAHCFVAAAGTEGRRQTVAASDLLVVVGLAHVPAVIVQGDDIARKALKVKNLVYHPEFQPSVFGNDIALVQLEKPTGVPAMPITGPDDRNSDLAGLSATIVGWGFTQESDGANTDLLPADLQEAEMPIVDIATCKAAYSTSALKGNSIDDHNICAGFKMGGRDACRGDSGGPLMVRSETGEWVQAGIVSWGEGCGRRDRYGVYTRLSAFEGWVREVTGGQVARPLRPSQEARFVDTQMTVATLSPSDGQDQDGPLFQLTSPTELARAAARIAPGDRALVIGIDGYIEPMALTGSVTDATAISGMLVDELGFRREQVLTLTNEKATRANILAALDTWLLQGTHAGSRVYLYYSGQGFQSRVFPSLRDSESGPAIAPVDLSLIKDNDGKVRDVANAISASEIRQLLSRLSNRSVTMVFDASQISRREMQRPARASAEEVGSVRSVEAVVDLAPDITEVALPRPGTAIEPGNNLALWTATAPDQWALVDKRGDVPMGVFTRNFIDGLRATKLVSRGQADTSLAGLAKTISASSDRFCETNVRLCRLGVNPQLIAPPSMMMASLTAGAHPAGIVARSIPVIQNPAGVMVDQKPDAKAAGRSSIVVTARRAGYLIVIRIYPDGSLRQIFPDLTRLAQADTAKPRDKTKRPVIDANQMTANQPFTLPPDQSPDAARTGQSGGILLAILADQPVQGLDLPENSFARNDAFGTLFFIHDYSATLKVPQGNGTMKDVEWSFDAKVLPDAAAAQ